MLQKNQVLISQTFYERVADQVKVMPLGFFEPKGKSENVEIFELLDIS